MSSESNVIQKLVGSSNYTIWALRMKALLVDRGLKAIITTDDVSDDVNDRALAAIQLFISDGPLLHVQNDERAHGTWNKLKSLYSSTGFSSEFIIIKEFFRCKLKKYSSMEEFINKIKQLNDELTSRELALPRQVVMSWVLDNLTSEYGFIVTGITQSLRVNPNSYDLDMLFSSLVDESKRLSSIDEKADKVLMASDRGSTNGKPVWSKNKYSNNRVNKQKFCRHCRNNKHPTSDCWILFPEKAPKSWSRQRGAKPSNKKPNNNLQAQIEPESQVDSVLTSQDVEDINLVDMDFDFDANVEKVFTIAHICCSDRKANNSVKEPRTFLMEPTVSPFTLNPDPESVQVYNSSLIDINTPFSDQTKIDQAKLRNGSQTFILDTGATKHIICDSSLFAGIRPCHKIVKWGNADSRVIKGVGDVYLRFTSNNKIYCLKNCLFMPEMGINIISQSMMQDGYTTILDNNKVYVKSQGRTIAYGKNINGLYYLAIDAVVKPTHLMYTSTKHSEVNEIQPHSVIDVNNLHRKMGHLSHSYTDKLLENTDGYSKILNKDRADVKNCDVCIRSKFTNQISRSSSARIFSYLEKVSSDICGPFNPITFDNYKYFITFLDAKTKFLEVKLLRTKYEAFEAFITYANVYENNENGKRIRILATDNGTEFTNKRFKSLLDKKGITHQLSPVYTKEPNGLVERINRTIVNKIRSLLIQSNLPKYMWGEACYTATHLYNRSPHAGLDFKTPYELKHGRKPDISKIKTFGSVCYYKNKGNNIKKLDDKAIKGILVGFNDSLYKVYNPGMKKCIWARDVHILENKFIQNPSQLDPPNNGVAVKLKSLELKSRDFDLYKAPNQALNSEERNDTTVVEPNVDEIATAHRDHWNGDEAVKISKSQSSLIIPLDEDDTDELALLVNINKEPNTFKQAMSCDTHQEWQMAMQAEIDELERQNTWSLTPLPHDKIPLRGRWVYKLKTDLQGQITKYKARSVVKGFNQVPGVDYSETFSTTCRPESYRLIFILAMHNKWHLNQYDVKNAFIHAEIDHDIYVEQPHGFEKPQNVQQSKKLYCKLRKALYGLKQSPRLWYEHLLGVLKKHGFQEMPYDSAIFIHPAQKLIIVCHVDDLIMTGPDPSLIEKCVSELSKSLKIEKIGNINQFLRMQIVTDYKNQTIHMNQSKYTAMLLEKFEKQNLKPVTSPVEQGVNLEKSSEPSAKENIHKYQQQVVSLIYLAISTRPDISFAVNRCARYMANPNESHFRALERIWKYLCQYPNLGLYYDCKIINESILGFTDADWGGDTIGRKSTSGYIFHLNGNIISWLSMQQKTVALSSCEAEYMAFKEAIKESIYLNNLLDFYNNFLKRISPNQIPKLMTDSDSALKLANNPEFHKRTKHIDITYHFIRNSIKEKKVQLIHVGTKNQQADGFTKGLDTIKHKSFLLTLNLK